MADRLKRCYSLNILATNKKSKGEDADTYKLTSSLATSEAYLFVPKSYLSNYETTPPLLNILDSFQKQVTLKLDSIEVADYITLLLDSLIEASVMTIEVFSPEAFPKNNFNEFVNFIIKRKRLVKFQFHFSLNYKRVLPLQLRYILKAALRRKPVLPCSNLSIIEKYSTKTDIINRENAMKLICNHICLLKDISKYFKDIELPLLNVDLAKVDRLMYPGTSLTLKFLPKKVIKVENVIIKMNTLYGFAASEAFLQFLILNPTMEIANLGISGISMEMIKMIVCYQLKKGMKVNLIPYGELEGPEMKNGINYFSSIMNVPLEN